VICFSVLHDSFFSVRYSVPLFKLFCFCWICLEPCVCSASYWFAVFVVRSATFVRCVDYATATLLTRSSAPVLRPVGLFVVPVITIAVAVCSLPPPPLITLPAPLLRSSVQLRLLLNARCFCRPCSVLDSFVTFSWVVTYGCSAVPCRSLYGAVCCSSVFGDSLVFVLGITDDFTATTIAIPDCVAAMFPLHSPFRCTAISAVLVADLLFDLYLRCCCSYGGWISVAGPVPVWTLDFIVGADMVRCAVFNACVGAGNMRYGADAGGVLTSYSATCLLMNELEAVHICCYCLEQERVPGSNSPVKACLMFCSLCGVDVLVTVTNSDTGYVPVLLLFYPAFEYFRYVVLDCSLGLFVRWVRCRCLSYHFGTMRPDYSAVSIRWPLLFANYVINWFCVRCSCSVVQCCIFPVTRPFCSVAFHLPCWCGGTDLTIVVHGSSCSLSLFLTLPGRCSILDRCVLRCRTTPILVAIAHWFLPCILGGMGALRLEYCSIVFWCSRGWLRWIKTFGGEHLRFEFFIPGTNGHYMGTRSTPFPAHFIC